MHLPDPKYLEAAAKLRKIVKDTDDFAEKGQLTQVVYDSQRRALADLCGDFPEFSSTFETLAFNEPKIVKAVR